MIATLAILALLGVFVLLIWYGQERILFQPPSVYERPPLFGRVEYRAQDGQSLVGYLVGDPRTSPGVLVCFHGNADLAMWQLEWGQRVHEHSEYSVFLAEYRGYMGLAGTPSYASTRLDAEAAINYIDAAYGTLMLSYFGHSLGSAIATELAQVRKPRALLLQSPFVSARAMARLIVSPPVEKIWSRMSRIHFETRNAVASLDVPVSVAHGTSDRLVPVKMGLEVYEAAMKKGELLIVDRAGHNNVPEVAGDAYWKWIKASLPAKP
ncbi:MAG TPA: alpha/beta hydrolase [Gemmatimonadaceae bacterium]|nr:alpha/beta hydrolase [Gemmatimonadaceae bacterium]